MNGAERPRGDTPEPSPGAVMPVWYAVDPFTLDLSPVDQPTAWNAGKREPEQSLETLVSLNLRTLFPGEDLLLLHTQDQLCPMADIAAIDPMGCLRLMEVKATAVGQDELRDQVLGYALGEVGNDGDQWERGLSWQLRLAPHRFALVAEGVRGGVRTKGLGRAHAAEPDRARWEALGYAERMVAVIAAARRRRGADDTWDEGLAAMLRRVYGLTAAEATSGDAFERVVRGWNARPRRRALESVMIGPNVAPDPGGALATRGVCFDLIQAELRRISDGGDGERLVLRWGRESRSPNELRPAVIQLYRAVQSIDPDASGFRWLPKWPALSWHTGELFHIKLDPGAARIIAGAHWLTGKNEYAKPGRQKGFKAIHAALRDRGIRADGPAGALTAPWTASDLEPAALLISAYFRLGRELGLPEYGV